MNSETYKIICHGYPPEFNLDKNLAKEYFKQFGKTKRLTFSIKQRICTVEYANQEGYLQALNNAGEYKGTTLNISSFDEITKTKREVAKKKEPLWMDKNEIEAELAAMSGYAPKSHRLEGSTSPLRDSSKFEKVPKLKRSWKNENLTKPKKVDKAKKSMNTRISGEEMELVKLVLSQAFTSEDKYKILDARDKLLKIKLKKFPPEKSTATIGTCPDMCPEKERLFREIKHQVAWYEQDENEKCMNHNKAVKQYSRSSADQEAPLAHELRSVPVLQMTMGYLLHNIVDLCDTDEVHLGEWFHFLWDRTRGIRKDITQQALCSQGAVELVEQCARFHIHCSARLVAEDPSVFDQKINTENLTKCLQTLKYMYHDLLLKGEKCENEAEFRAYIILLNLNDGNFMWEVQQLPHEIQRSKEVRFALQVHSAIDKNNYVKFFKLLYSTTYLNACILMRYFVQVRLAAVKILLKCYNPRIAKTSFPLTELQFLLAFDDLDSTIYFVQFYGLSINDDGTHVILNKNHFVSPDYPCMLDRSGVIEEKRTFSVARIICGKDLPPKTYETHAIQQSFDKKGNLIAKDVLDELDLEKVKLNILEELDKTKEEIVSEVEMKEEEKCDTSLIFDQKIKSNAFEKEQKFANPNPFAFTKQLGKPSNIFNTAETPQSTMKNIFAPQFTFQSPIPPVAIPSQEKPDFVTKNADIFSAIPNPTPAITDQPKEGGFSFNLIQPQQNVQPTVTITPINTTNIEHSQPPLTETTQRDEDLEKERKTKEENQQKLEKLRLKLIEEQMKLEIKQQQEHKRLQEAKIEAERIKREIQKRKLDEEIKKKLEEVQKEEAQMIQINDDVKNILNHLIDEVDNNIRNEKLNNIKKNVERRMLLESLNKWKLYSSRKKRKRKAMDCNPIWVGAKSLDESAEDLHTSSQDLTLTLMKRYKYGMALDLEQTIDDNLHIVNLYQLTYSILKNRIFQQTINKPKNIFWKMVISLPDRAELENGLNRIEDTLNRTFTWKNCNGRTLFLDQVKVNSTESVTYCVEKQQGYDVKRYDSNGMIFIAKNFNPNLQRRIFENLKGFGVYTKVPIVIILQECNPIDCKLEELIKENIVSDYDVLIENIATPKLLNVIEEGLIFLAKKVESSPPLELDTLKSFMIKHLCSEIWKRANSFGKWNSNYNKCLQTPNVVLSLYNEGLNRLKSVILNESNREYAEFPEEFEKYLPNKTPHFFPCSYRYFPKFWKNKNYFTKLEEILKKLHLPKWHDIWPPSNEYELEMSVFKYCSKITKEPLKLFYTVMSVLLRKVDPNLNFQDVENVLWTDIVELFGMEKLKSNIIPLSEEFKPKSILDEYFVVYNVNELCDYRYCDWFYICNPRIKKFIKENIETVEIEVKSSAKDVAESFKMSDDYIDSIRNNYLLNKPDKSDMLRELDELKKSLDCLAAGVAVHQKISTKLDESLSRAIAEK